MCAAFKKRWQVKSKRKRVLHHVHHYAGKRDTPQTWVSSRKTEIKYSDVLYQGK